MLPKNTEPHRAYLSRRAKDLESGVLRESLLSCKLLTRSQPKVSRRATPLSRSTTWRYSIYRGRHGLCKYQGHPGHFPSPLRPLFLENIDQNEIISFQTRHSSHLHLFVQIYTTTLLDRHPDMVRPGQLSHPAKFIKSNERNKLQLLRYIDRFRGICKHQ